MQIWADLIFLGLLIRSIKSLTHPSTYPPSRHISLSPLICCAFSFIVFLSGIHSPWRYNCSQRPVCLCFTSCSNLTLITVVGLGAPLQSWSVEGRYINLLNKRITLPS